MAPGWIVLPDTEKSCAKSVESLTTRQGLRPGGTVMQVAPLMLSRPTLA